MSNPTETYVEKFVQAVLVQNSPIGIIPANLIIIQADDTESLAKKDRITCSAIQTRKVALKSFDGAALKQIWIALTLTLWTGPSFAAVDIQTATEEMLNALNTTNVAQFSADSLSAFTSAKIARWEDTDDGQFETQDNGRKRACVMNFLCNV